MNILIVFDTRYGNTMKLVEAASQGAQEAGAKVKVTRTKVVEPEAIIPKNEYWKAAHEKFIKFPEWSLDDCKWADGLIIASPTRFGNMSAPLKMFIDGLSPLWLTGDLIGKPAGCITSTSSMHGGQETTLVSMYFPLLHHGMIIVGVPYSVKELITTSRGGTPYGATSVSGHLANQGPNEEELAIARALGRRVAEVAGKLRGT